MSPPPDTPLIGTRWIAREIDGKPLSPDDELWIRLDAEQRRINGDSGVNRFGGNFDLDDEGSLRFGELLSTRKGGPADAMARESALFTALTNTRSYRLDGNTLSLHDQTGIRVARCEAAHIES